MLVHGHLCILLFSSSKLIPYIVPCFLSLAILIASDFDRMIERGKWHGKRPGIFTGLWGTLFCCPYSLFVCRRQGRPVRDTADRSLMITAGLLLRDPCWHCLLQEGAGRRLFEKAAAVLCLSAAVYIAAHYGIYDMMGRTRSTKGISEVIMKEKLPRRDHRCLRRDLQGHPFIQKSVLCL